MNKKLTKGTDKKICGVCSGIANYLECDPTIVRLAAIALTLCAGGGLLLYIIGAIVMPNVE
ncbi:MAG: PspC domain-containing protein [Clostridia bacterium]|nr:PspC domain-containing protein [Clostridia bacterium]